MNVNLKSLLKNATAYEEVPVLIFTSSLALTAENLVDAVIGAGGTVTLTVKGEAEQLFTPIEQLSAGLKTLVNARQHELALSAIEADGVLDTEGYPLSVVTKKDDAFKITAVATKLGVSLSPSESKPKAKAPAKEASKPAKLDAKRLLPDQLEQAIAGLKGEVTARQNIGKDYILLKMSMSSYTYYILEGYQEDGQQLYRVKRGNSRTALEKIAKKYGVELEV